MSEQYYEVDYDYSEPSWYGIEITDEFIDAELEYASITDNKELNEIYCMMKIGEYV